eukprot:TRINITY_DN19462_c0_g1_i1.p1 TRINITY_DN19462_c0_g1~~TRINITY_DN19462_c0_g1_i1.p1  ORF type:complete len:449 (+),score=92.80 TRINITY_DN19462_c0_g1_i1:126-1349(+)
MGVFKRLSKAEQAVVLHMVCYPDGALLEGAAKEIFTKNNGEVDVAVRLGVLVEKTKGWCLNKRFKDGMRVGVEQEGVFRAGQKRKRQSEDAAAAGTVLRGTLDGVSQWETVLKMLLPSGGNEPSIKGIAIFLQSGGFMSGTGGLTMRGFQFLMSPTRTQVWLLLREFFNASYKGKAAETLKTQFISLLFALPFMDEETKYPRDPILSKNLAASLPFFGVICYDETSDAFYPTPLGKLLSLPEEGSLRKGHDVRDGDLIVESNNRVYLYSSDPFKIDMLGLFAEIELKMEGMTSGRLTRESLQTAFFKDISAYQIINYLESNSHPEMGNHIPTTVVDQILSWESELKRVTFTPAVLLTHPAHVLASMHSLAKQTSKSIDADILHSTQTRLVLSPEIYRKVKGITEKPS